MKSSVLTLTAGVFMIDGLFRKGAYFGARIERYILAAPWMNWVGMSIVGIAVAVSNYLVANHSPKIFCRPIPLSSTYL